jgi:hypothetical protein
MTPWKDRSEKIAFSRQNNAATPSMVTKGIDRCKEESADDTSPSPSPKRKRKTGATSSPRRTAGMKWSVEEERVIKRSVVVYGEVGTNWHDILQDLNAQRSANEQRSMHSLKQHWTVAMRAKMMD